MIQNYIFLEPLVLVFKKFLALKDLNSPFLGGLSSYGLILLIISLINGNFQEHLTNSGEPSLGRTFFHFLFFYGKIFQPNSLMITEDMLI